MEATGVHHYTWTGHGVINDHVKHTLENLDSVIVIILSKLSMKSLQSACRVCRKWHFYGTKMVKERRKQIAWTFCNKYSPENMMKQIRVPIENVASEPREAIVFTSSALYENRVAMLPSPGENENAGGRLPRKAKLERVELEDYFDRILPPQCRVFGVATDGIIGSATNSLVVDEVESEESVTALLLPKIPGVSTYMFRCNLPELEILQATKGDLSTVTGLASVETVVLTLLFYSDPNLSTHPLAPARLFLENQRSRVVAGGYVDSFVADPPRPQAGDEEYNESVVQGFLFAVPKDSTDVKVASTYLDYNVRCEADVKAHLERLKASHVPERNSIAFMLACIARGEEHYGKRNVESSVFRELFPHTPLFGIFGNGEIGHHYLPDYTSRESVEDWERRRIVDEVHHSYTTIFVLLSFGEQAGNTIV